MATKQFTATKSFKYGTRMLRAGDPVELDGPNARLYTALGAIEPFRRPAAAKGAVPAMTTQNVQKTAATPRKRTTKKRATAKK